MGKISSSWFLRRTWPSLTPLQRICTAQHTGKQEHTVSMRGRVSWADMQRIYTAGFLTGRVATSIKYLGAGFIMRGDKRKRLPFVPTLQKTHGHVSGDGRSLVQIWHFQTSAHHGVQEFDSQHAPQRFGNDGYDKCGVQTIGRLHSGFLSGNSCVERPRLKKQSTDRRSPNIALLTVQEQWYGGRAPSAIELRIARLGVSFQRVSNDSMVAGPSSALVRFCLRHMIPSLTL